MVLHHTERDCTGAGPGHPPTLDIRHGWVQSVEDIAPILDHLAAEMRARGYPRQDAFAVRRALEEAVVNAIKHGHRARPEQRVRVSYLVADEWLLLEVEDRGPGFDLSVVPDPLADEHPDEPSGRGLLLIRHYMSWVRFFGRGNIVTMCRKRSGR